jgi:hypothetical protein
VTRACNAAAFAQRQCPRAGLPGSEGAAGKNGVDGRPGYPGPGGKDGAAGPAGKDGQAPNLDEFYGTLQGVVRKATDASYVRGATVDVMADKQVIRSAVTPASGKFTFKIPGGEYVVRVSNIPGMDGVVFTEPVDINNMRTEERTYAVAPPVGAGKLRFVLTWGELPRDLDSHLVTSSGCNVWYAHKQCPDGEATLDTDVEDSFGPETINIHALKAGLYKCVQLQPVARAASHECRRYKVHAFTDGAMEESDAEVTPGPCCARSRSDTFRTAADPFAPAGDHLRRGQDCCAVPRGARRQGSRRLVARDQPPSERHGQDHV